MISNATYKLSELLIIFVNISENDTTKDILIDLHIVDSLLHLLPITSLDRDQRIQTLQLLHKLRKDLNILIGKIWSKLSL